MSSAAIFCGIVRRWIDSELGWNLERIVQAGYRKFPRKAEENYEECQSVSSFSLPALKSCSFQTRTRHCTHSSCCRTLVICGVAPDRAGQYSVCLRTARREGRFPAAWFLSRFVPQSRPSLGTAHSASQYASGDIKSWWKSRVLGMAVTSFNSVHLLGKSDEEREVAVLYMFGARGWICGNKTGNVRIT